MSDKNLTGAAAIDKIREIAEGIDFTMFATDLAELPFHVVPMSTKKVDKDGAIWFLSGKDSNHNRNIVADSRVHLSYSDKGAMEFLTVCGTATIIEDKDVLNALYGQMDDAWFDGADDPNLSAIRVTPSDAYYWDAKSNKLVTMIKMGVAAVTGDEPDLMDTGRADV